MAAAFDRLRLRAVCDLGEKGAGCHSGAAFFIREGSGHIAALARLLDRTGAFNRRDSFGHPALGGFQLELLKYLIETEEQTEIDRGNDQFRQQVLISPLRLFDPNLYDRLFDPDYVDVDEEESPTSGVMFPTTDEEFDAMLEEWGEGSWES